jgi:hypothetical protein
MTDPQPAEHDSSNPGLKVIGLEYKIKPDETQKITVLISGK